MVRRIHEWLPDPAELGMEILKKPEKEVDKAIRKSILPLFKGQGLEASGSMKGEQNGS